MANCDLCNKTLSDDDQYRISAKRVNLAVQAGYNPYKNSSRIKNQSIGRMFSIRGDEDQRYRDSADNVLSDATEWIVCLECHARLLLRGI
jgi:hypothetical protein